MKNPDMKIRVSPELRSLIEASAKVNERTLNAEVSARLQWSFDAGYDARAETKAVQKTALATVQASPIIRMEKRLISVEADLREQIDALKERVQTLETSGRK